MANGNVYACDPRCVPGFARAEIISALLFAAAATAILAKRLAKKQKLPWDNRRMANDNTWGRPVLTDISSVYSDIGGSVAAAKLAVKDFGAAAKRMKVELS
jgi:hypothetical protein